MDQRERTSVILLFISVVLLIFSGMVCLFRVWFFSIESNWLIVLFALLFSPLLAWVAAFIPTPHKQKMIGQQKKVLSFPEVLILSALIITLVSFLVFIYFLLFAFIMT